MSQGTKDGMHGSMQAHEECFKTIIANHQEMMQKVLDSNLNMRKYEMNNKMESERHMLREYKNQMEKHHEELEQLRYDNIIKERTIEQLEFEKNVIEHRHQETSQLADQLHVVEEDVNQLFRDESGTDSKHLKDQSWGVTENVRLIVLEYKHVKEQLALTKERLQILETGLGSSEGKIDRTNITAPKLRAHYTSIIKEQAERITYLVECQEELMKQLDVYQGGASWSDCPDEPEQAPSVVYCVEEEEEQEEEPNENNCRIIRKAMQDAAWDEWWEEQRAEKRAMREAKQKKETSEQAGEGWAEADQNTDEYISVVGPEDGVAASDQEMADSGAGDQW